MKKIKILLIFTVFSSFLFQILYSQTEPFNDKFIWGKTKLEGIVENRELINGLKTQIEKMQQRIQALEQEVAQLKENQQQDEKK